MGSPLIILLFLLPVVAQGCCSLSSSSAKNKKEEKANHHHHHHNDSVHVLDVNTESLTSSLRKHHHSLRRLEEMSQYISSPTSTEIPAPASSSSSSSSPPLLSSLNATVISYSACQQIDLAISYITSLDLDQSTLTSTTPNDSSNNNKNVMSFWDVYLMQIVITPVCLLLLFFGSHLLLPASILCAAALGVFFVFHILAQYMKNHFGGYYALDCHMKLALSAVAAFLTALSASTCIKFGLFSVGAVAAGGAAYLVMDAFPVLDLGGTIDSSNHDMNNNDTTMTASDLSSFAWLVTISMGIFGGVFIRAYEQASLEILTAIIGGIGCAYSLHTFVILQGGELDRALVFLFAFLLSLLGCRFQRKRRLARTMRLWSAKNDDEDLDDYDLSGVGVDGSGLYSPVMVHTNNSLPRIASSSAATAQSQPSWQQLQQSIDSLHGKLSAKDQNSNNNSQASALPLEQLEELAMALNALLKDKQGTGGASGNKVQEGKEI